MKYRSRTEIVSMILEAANGGATKTRIMYKAFLSYAQLREYLSVLMENNLLEYLEGTQTYKTTEKGFNLLRMHNEIGELLQTPIRESRIRINKLKSGGFKFQNSRIISPTEPALNFTMISNSNIIMYY